METQGNATAFESFLKSLNEELQPLQTNVHRWIEAEGFPNQRDPGSFDLLPRPRLGPEAFAIHLYPPFNKETIRRYEQLHDFVIPEPYKKVLMKLNGLHAFQFFSLYGLLPSMTENPPLMDRNRPGPLDLSTANRLWIYEFSLKEMLFHFGGGIDSDGEGIGYFLRPDEQILAYRKNGKLIRSWVSFRAFLEEELSRAEQYFPQYEDEAAKFLAEYQAKKPQKKRRSRAVIKPPRKKLTSMATLPKDFLAQRMALGFDRIDYGVGGIELLSASDWPEFAKDFHSVVIGHEPACGDRLLVSGEPPHAVFAAYEEESPRLIAPSLNSFWECLRVFSEFAQGRSNPVEVEANPPSDSEIKSYIADLRPLLGGSEKALEFWIVQIEIDPGQI